MSKSFPDKSDQYFDVRNCASAFIKRAKSIVVMVFSILSALIGVT